MRACVLVLLLAAAVLAEDALTSTPLAPRKAGAGPLFERLDGERTGIDFVHAYDLGNADKRALLATGFVGCGVCVGDFDGDGRPDLFVTAQDTGNRLYRNTGDFRFADVTKAAGVGGAGRWCTGAVFVDIENDGDLDLCVSVYNGANLLYVNQGDGTFKEEGAARGLAHKGGSVQTVFADYDRDGDLDAYVVTYYDHKGEAAQRVAELKRRAALGLMFDPVMRDELGNPQGLRPEVQGVLTMILDGNGAPRVVTSGEPDRLYRNEGDGTFTDVSKAAGIAGDDHGWSAVWWDYNGDRYPDLYVCNTKYGPDRLYRNNADGTFTESLRETLPHCGWYTKSADIGDLDNDGRLDLIVTDQAARTRAGRVRSSYPEIAGRWFIRVASPRQALRNSIFINSGRDRFLEAARLMGAAHTGWTWTAQFGDLDCDGRTDLFLATGMTRDYGDTDLHDRARSDKKAFLRAPPRLEPDVAFRNRGGYELEDVTRAWGLDGANASFGAVLADLDRDGDLDLVVTRFEAPLGVYRNRGASGRRVLVRLVGARSPRDGHGSNVTVFTKAGRVYREVSPGRGFLSAQEPVLHFGLGEHDAIAKLTVKWLSGHVQEFVDLKAGRMYTIREPDLNPPVERPFALRAAQFAPLNVLDKLQHIERPYNDGERQELLPAQLSLLGPGLAWGDVDGDGDEDVYLGAAAGEKGMLALRNRFDRYEVVTAPFAAHAECEDLGALFFDADGDGDLDLYVVSGSVEAADGLSWYGDRLYRNDGKGGFARDSKALPLLRDSGGTVVAADVDRDGDLDLFVGGRVVPGKYPLPAPSRLLVNEGGRFRASELTTGMVTAALWSDVDGDGWLDLLLTHEWGAVSLVRNRKGRFTEVEAISDVGLWNGIAGGDVDNDGDIDYVVTNHGLNTVYGSRTRMARGVFGERKEPQLIQLDGDYPLRSLPVLSRVFPSVRKRYRTFASFAEAKASDVFRGIFDRRPYDATELRSGVLINDGKGAFTFRPLPRIAQVAPAYGVVVNDLDGDGRADVLLTQNSFAGNLDVGWFAGGIGQLLRGNGDGMFEARPAADSGFVVPGAGKAVTLTDFNDDGWPDVALSVTGGMAQLYRNAKAARGRPFRVRLVGKKGNPRGIGARITLRRVDGSTQTNEVYAGSGYLGQSTTDSFFGLGVIGQPAAVIVRWPDGTTTETKFKPDAIKVVIEQPK